MQARFLRLAEWIASVGLESLSEPHVKHLEGEAVGAATDGPQWNCSRTVRHGDGPQGSRGSRIRVKKTQKTPRAEIELALQRAKEIT
jgi:hypothetical protein